MMVMVDTLQSVSGMFFQIGMAMPVIGLRCARQMRRAKLNQAAGRKSVPSGRLA
jgi:hypothetical protein